jgi:glyoxylate reductase
VYGKTLGIIGLGEIGQAVARRARGFGMKLIYHGPRRKMEAESGLNAGFRESLEDFLAEADIVSLHCPLTDSSRHLINAQSLSRMKPNSVLINTGRGPLVDESALVEALAGGHLGAVGLDVFEFEPQVTPALLEFPNVTLLPHIGSATGECRQDMAVSVVTNIKTFLASGKPVNLVT